jgi:predicted MFS family arabinose efflux permease
VLFAALFAAQAAVIALSPVLPRVAAELAVSTATAGQLRTAAGLAAGVAALLVTRWTRADLRKLMVAATGLVAVGSLLSSLAPTFTLLVAAQVVVGVGIGTLVSAATTAAAEWAPAEQRTRVLAWALVGQPTAWIVGMPLIGFLGQTSWRYGLLALPLTASLLAAGALATRPRPAAQARDADLLGALQERDFSRWVAGELLANAGWAGTLVYSGALFLQSYDTSPALTGFLLAAAAAAFVGGNLVFRRLVSDDPRPQLTSFALALAIVVPLFGSLRPNVTVSAALFATAGFLAGGRTLIGNAFGLQAAPDRRLAVMGMRAATTQLGYFVGAAAAGAALEADGYAGLGLAMGGFFIAAAAAQAELSPFRRHLIGTHDLTHSSRHCPT